MDFNGKTWGKPWWFFTWLHHENIGKNMVVIYCEQKPWFKSEKKHIYFTMKTMVSSPWKWFVSSVFFIGIWRFFLRMIWRSLTMNNGGFIVANLGVKPDFHIFSPWKMRLQWLTPGVFHDFFMVAMVAPNFCHMVFPAAPVRKGKATLFFNDFRSW